MIKTGSTPFGLWHVVVKWNESVIMQIRFSKKPEGEDQVPNEIKQYLSGKRKNIPLKSILFEEDNSFQIIYRIVSKIPYGETRPYGEIAKDAKTHARVVGTAMRQNITPLIIPCHRVVSKDGIGGFTPDLQIKIDLLSLEQRNK